MKINNIPNILQGSLTDIKFKMNQIDFIIKIIFRKLLVLKVVKANY